jgi:citronellol/citronellal dehydrogenase
VLYEYFLNQVQNAIDQTVQKFGGIDILINNASAIETKTMENCSVNKFDLMNQVNARGTWLTSKLAIPHLIKSAQLGRNPHILVMSPPLDMRQHWFSPHVGYTMAKYAMVILYDDLTIQSMVVLGLSGELEEYGIAVNALWPLTGINTSAVSNVILAGNSLGINTTRKVDLMSEAAFAILVQNSRTFT